MHIAKGDGLAVFLQMCLNHMRATPASPAPQHPHCRAGERGGSGRGAASPVLIPSQRKKSDGGRRGNLLTPTNLGFP